MIDDEKPDEPQENGQDEPADIPPPSTFAGKARKAEAEGETEVDPADEQEEPPDEFAFEEEEAPGDNEFEEEEAPGEDEDQDAGSDPSSPEASEPESDREGSDDADADPDAGPAATPAGVSGVTVEADTLALADIEAQREAARAGLAKRAEKSSFSHEVTTSSHKVQPPKAAPPAEAATGAQAAAPATGEPLAEDDGVGKPPKRRIGWRFTAAAFVIVSSMAAATAVSFLLFLNDIAKGLNDPDLSAARAQLEEVEGGEPQTILILGSDARETTPGDPGRSDTAILLRVDPDKEFLSLMSLPRDLYVPIPGHGSEKLNAAYSIGEQIDPKGGGEELAIRTIRDYLDIPINHVVNVDFKGFYEAVNAIGCVYIDVDRHYFNPTGGVYAQIDVKAGYQRLCGYQALSYVRYRHTDNDLVRGARQQDFIREARQRIPPGELLPVFGRGDELIDIFTENTSSDINDPGLIIEMLKSFAAVRNAPVRQITLGELSPDGGVSATREQVEAAVNQFLGNDVEAAPEGEPDEPKPGSGAQKQDEKKPEPAEPPPVPLVDFAAPAQAKAGEFAQFMREQKAKLPVLYPTRLAQNSATAISEESRPAKLVGSNGKDIHHMYKFVVPYQEGFGLSYYGLSGTNWDDPPILRNPSTTRTIDGREYLLFYERDRLRLVGWRTGKGSYWAINTLTHALSEEQMLGIATSARELGN